MENFNEISETCCVFGLPFRGMDFNGLTQLIHQLSEEGGKHLFFAASMPWLLDFAKNPLICPVQADFILPTDSNLIDLAAKVGIKLKMPLEYFELPEQVARICAHFGYSMMHISETPLKTDILVTEGYVPHSWELFTHFKTDGELDEIDAQSIVAGINASKPKLVLLTATTKSLHKFLPQIYAQLSECILICIPQDAGTKSFEDKIEDIFSPMLLARKEKNFQKELQRKCLLTSQATLTSNENKDPAEISITGRLSSQISPELTQLGQAVFDAGQDIELNLSETIAISRNGLNAIFTMKSDADRAGKNITISAVHESIQNDLHQAGLAHFFEIFPPVLDELQEQT